MSQEKAKIPVWAIALIWSLLGAMIVGGVAWGAQRSDVDNLKTRVQALEKLPEAVARVETAVSYLQKNQTEMGRDVRDIKTMIQRGR